jgi:transaldolase
MSWQITTFQAAVAQAALAYKLYQKKFSGPRWEALVKKGAKKQRLLWASTSVKNPAYSDTLYVAPLIGPDTVSQLIFHIIILVLDITKAKMCHMLLSLR